MAEAIIQAAFCKQTRERRNSRSTEFLDKAEETLLVIRNTGNFNRNLDYAGFVGKPPKPSIERRSSASSDHDGSNRTPVTATPGSSVVNDVGSKLPSSSDCVDEPAGIASGSGW